MVQFTQNRVTPQDIEDFILEETYINAGDAVPVCEHDLTVQTLRCQTFCVLVLKNGFSVYGHSACADPASFDKQIGEAIARADAVNKIWPLLGFALRDKLHQVETADKPSSTVLDVHVGEKVVAAMPATRGEYNSLRGWKVPEDEDPTDAGYLVEYLDGGEPNHPDFKGYISWSPKDTFDRAYGKPIKPGAMSPAGQGQATAQALMTKRGEG